MIAPDIQRVRTAQDRHRKAVLRFRFRPKPASDCLETKVGVFAPMESGNRFPVSFVEQTRPGSCPRERSISFTPPPAQGGCAFGWERPPKVQKQQKQNATLLASKERRSVSAPEIKLQDATQAERRRACK